MNNSSPDFLAQLNALPSDCLEHRLGQRMAQLGLGALLGRNELTLLCEAALRAHFCQVAINEIHPDKMNPEHEVRRVRLEWEFMAATDVFFASPGWQSLEESLQDIITQMFLTVTVREECLAW